VVSGSGLTSDAGSSVKSFRFKVCGAMRILPFSRKLVRCPPARIREHTGSGMPDKSGTSTLGAALESAKPVPGIPEVTGIQTRAADQEGLPPGSKVPATIFEERRAAGVGRM
jgi:hypothetical protein